ncbi:MAG: 6-carboxytetrahydropterin synthase [Spirochaetales bacterium]|jgi:6-pyruvoyltetrahydropterin/6-carboxytetrahydropterin synthase|nr:6-carboxytetrahydropterin synthase [Spirochaetales bacterium]
MSKIRVTKEFSFETAHALWNYDGPCRNVHGHSYKLFVTLSGQPLDEPGNPRNGMVIDFGDLKKLVKREVVDVFDHSVVIGRMGETDRLEALKKMFGNVLPVDYQPTCENLIQDIAGRIKAQLPDGVILHNLRLYETATSYAEWFADDNK